MPQKTSTNGTQARSEVSALVREAAAARGIRTGPHAESGVDLLTLRFTQNVHQLAKALREKAVGEAEQQAQATTQRMSDNAKAEAEEIVQAATQRAQQTEQQAQATTQRMLDDAKTEAEEIVQAATQRAQQTEQEAKAAVQRMLDNAETEAEEIVRAATQRANDLDTKVEAKARDLAERINEQHTSFMGAIEDVLSKPGDSGKGSEDDPEARSGNPLPA